MKSPRPKPQSREFEVGTLVYTYVGNYAAQVVKHYHLEDRYQIRYCVPDIGLLECNVLSIEIYRAAYVND